MIHECFCEEGIVPGDRLGEPFSAGKTGDGCQGRFLILLGRDHVVGLRRVLFFLAGLRPFFLDGLPVEKHESSGLGFLLEIGEIYESADGGFGDSQTCLGGHIFTPIERRDQTPVMRLLDLMGEGVVMALCTFDLGAEDHGSDGFRDRLMIVFVLIEEPQGTSSRVGWMIPGLSCKNDLIDHFVPGSVFRECAIEKTHPAVLVPLNLLGGSFAAQEEQIKDPGHVSRVVRTTGEPLNEPGPFRGVT